MFCAHCWVFSRGGIAIAHHVSRGRLATVTLNGTLDRVMLIPEFLPGDIYNVSDARVYGSGKGLNVARTALALGKEVRATGLVAGQCGEWICDLLHAERMPERFFHLPGGQSRIATIVVDVERGHSTVINGPGPTVSSNMWPVIRSAVDDAVEDFEWLALGGSVPQGLPDIVYAELCSSAQERGQRVCLDTRDCWLAQALSAQPCLVKCNQYEAATVLGRRIEQVEQAQDAALEWAAAGVRYVAITMGAQGAVAASAQKAWHIEAPRIKDALCPIGSGDAMMGGLIVALDRGASWPEAVRYGVAVGAANTLVPGSGYLDLEALPDLISQTSVRLL
jgi:tagatose 6-phosphate kinase